MKAHLVRPAPRSRLFSLTVGRPSCRRQSIARPFFPKPREPLFFGNPKHKRRFRPTFFGISWFFRLHRNFSVTARHARHLYCKKETAGNDQNQWKKRRKNSAEVNEKRGDEQLHAPEHKRPNDWAVRTISRFATTSLSTRRPAQQKYASTTTQPESTPV